MAIGLTYDNVKDWLGSTAKPKNYTDSQGNFWVWSTEDGTYVQSDFVVTDKKPAAEKKNNTWIIVLVVVIGLAAGALIIKKLF
jgi:hypothetical protein